MKKNKKKLFICYVVLSWVSGIWVAQGNEIKTISFPVTDEIQKAEIFFDVTCEDPNFILVLCPRFNQSSRDWLLETEWLAFAKVNKVGLVGTHFVSKGDDVKAGKGYYYVERGAADYFFDGIEEAFGESLPILIYGQGGGAQFASRLVEHAPERFLGWSAFSASWWQEPKWDNRTEPPGIISSYEENGLSYEPSFQHFRKGRIMLKPWTWLVLAGKGQGRSPENEAFTRRYFEALMGAGDIESIEGVYCDIETKKPIAKEAVFFYPDFAVWFPSQTIADNWNQLHQP